MSVTPHIRIRIAVCINASGEWAAYAFGKGSQLLDSEAFMEEVAVDMMPNRDIDAKHWVEAVVQLPLPEKGATVLGVVT